MCFVQVSEGRICPLLNCFTDYAWASIQYPCLSASLLPIMTALKHYEAKKKKKAQYSLLSATNIQRFNCMFTVEHIGLLSHYKVSKDHISFSHTLKSVTLMLAKCCSCILEDFTTLNELLYICKTCFFPLLGLVYPLIVFEKTKEYFLAWDILVDLKKQAEQR